MDKCHLYEFKNAEDIDVGQRSHRLRIVINRSAQFGNQIMGVLHDCLPCMCGRLAL